MWAGTDFLEQKRDGKYVPKYVMVDRGTLQPVAVGVLTKSVAFLGTWWYLPAGPAGENVTAVIEIVAAVTELARKQRAFLLKVEPRLERDSIEQQLGVEGWKPAVRIIPNPATIIVDVRGTEAEVFARLGKKARNSITRAGRDGLVAQRVRATDTNCSAAYRLLSETADGRFSLRSEHYYRSFWQRFESSGNGQLFFVEQDGVLLAAAFAMALGDKTTYKDGASLREKRAYGASHLVQWEVLRWAIERGASGHDLCGVPPVEDSGNPQHPLFGVGRFKRSFSTETTEYVGLFDVPIRRFVYFLWSIVGEKIARHWAVSIRKDPYY